MKASIDYSNDNNRLFAALKLIEYIYHCGMIEKYVFRNILNEYADRVDISHFQQ